MYFKFGYIFVSKFDNRINIIVSKFDNIYKKTVYIQCRTLTKGRQCFPNICLMVL